MHNILITRDKVKIAYEHQRRGSDAVIIVAPGFFNSKTNRWMRKALELLGENYDTIIFDFRGHGDSGGKFSWSAKEHLDLEAVLNYAKSQNYQKIGILAFSLGAAASANLAAKRDDIDSMVLVSCPYSFWKIDYHFWKPAMFSDLKDNIECNWEGKGAKVTNILIPKPKPIKSITKIKETPIFFIHGDKDWIINDYHSQKLYQAAKVNKRIEVIKNGMHAERLIQQFPDKMKSLVLKWFSRTL